MPRLVEPTRVERPKPKAPRGPPGVSRGRYDRLAIPGTIGAEKLALAQIWGLRPGRMSLSRNGRVSCHAVGREDKLPSASFHDADGIYQDRKDGRRLTFFDLGVELGAFNTPGRSAAIGASTDTSGRAGKHARTRPRAHCRRDARVRARA